MAELTLAAAMQLRALLRAAGVEGMPGVRISAAPDGALAILIEDRSEPGDTVNESRGIRFYLDAGTSTLVRDAVVDLDGAGFVLKRTAAT